MKLSKFGGVCMANAENIKKSAEIIKQNNKRKIVVVSAPGQRFSTDIKITDRLYQCYNEVVKTGKCDKAFAEVEKHFLEIINAFNLSKYTSILKTIKQEIENSKNVDAVVSKGEYLMAQIFADIISYEFVDAGKIIAFDNNNKLNKKQTFKLIKQELSKIKKGVVIPGFYGKNALGDIVTFTRDGTDFTASIVATACEVKVYENWKDVDGIYTSNPNIIKNPKKIRKISYTELRLLSYLGAKVVHPSTVIPVREKNIPIEIKSFLNSSAKGTKISNKQSTNRFSAKAITTKNNLILLTIKKEMQENETRFLVQLLNILDELDIALTLFKVDIDNIYVVIPYSRFILHEKHLMHKLNNMQLSSLEVEHIALVSIVGNNLCIKPRLLTELCATLKNNDIDVKFIKTDGELSFVSLAVYDYDENLAVTTLYNKLFNN